MRLRSLSGALAVLLLATLMGCGGGAQPRRESNRDMVDYFGYSPTADQAVSKFLRNPG